MRVARLGGSPRFGYAPALIQREGTAVAQASDRVVSIATLHRTKRAALNVAWLLLVAAALEFLLMMYRNYGHTGLCSCSIARRPSILGQVS